MGVPVQFASCSVRMPSPQPEGGHEMLQAHTVEYSTEILTRAE